MMLRSGRSGLQSPPFHRAFQNASRGFASEAYDVAVIGGGPGGYVAAIKSAQLGLKTVCVEKRGALGGTCLNVGCIPSKALLNISHKYHEMLHDYAKMGISFDNPAFDVAKMMAQKEKSVKGLTGGIEFLFKRNKVDYIKGWGKLTGPTEVSVDLNEGGSKQLSAKNIIIATGSDPAPMPGGSLVADEKTILTSTGAIALEDVPKKMVVVGGGYIGLELGSVWGRLGAEIEVVEFTDKIAGTLDGEVGKAFQKTLEKQGMKFHLGTKVVGAEVHANGATVITEPAKGGAQSKIECDKILLSVGRVPFTEGLGLEQLGVTKDKMGRVDVDPHTFQVPNFPSLRAIGDVIVGPMLAHKAEEEGIAAVELIAGQGAGHVNYNAIPGVVYTHPEVAGVGLTEEQCKEQKIAYKKGSFPFAANSRARTNDDSEGLVKVITEAESDKVIGAHMIGPNAGELIAEMVLAIEYGAASEDVARTCHAHPTLSEAVKEACMAAHGKPIHFG
ncbi:unnamed protein product [Vitrella brassicaformis CCMP3155]|uniref:Dihydrolipoyl dehydrogenase n=1 Tax=Vitrella brassicaformis (strain CCMP3155) TaxID=1169540 RepID=A0A0G4G533_VITBC|nr:unnamed protein product [Vitrella brassicaformis CCMP3155]|eukprot:CEM23213.1 unnamed protein product [Vitrella brassicaformis CCMP3155]